MNSHSAEDAARKLQQDTTETAFRAVGPGIMERLQSIAGELLQGSLGAWYWKIREDAVVVEPNLAAMFEVDPLEAIQGMPLARFTRVMHPDDRPRVEAAITLTVAMGADLDQTFRICRNGGAVVWVRALGRAERAADGSIVALPGVAIDVSSQREAETALERSEERFRLIMQNSPDGFIILKAVRGHDGQVVDFEISYANPASTVITGRPASELAGRRLLTEFPGNIESGSFDDYVSVADGNGVTVREFPYDDGRLKAWFRVLAVPDPEGCAITFTDITERKSGEEALRASEERFSLLVENIKDYAIFSLDPSGRILTWNPAAQRILGYEEAEVLGIGLDVIFTAEDRERGIPQAELLAAAETGRGQDKRWHVRKDGTRFWAEGVVTPLRDASGALTGYAKVLRDETESRRTEEKILYQALHDALTGLPNRLLLEDRVQQALEVAKRGGTGLAVLFLDLDRFKNINDTLGHQIGDQVLQEVALRLRSCVRAEDTVARLGGDEFTVLLSGLRAKEEVAEIATSIISALKAVFRVVTYDLHLGVSIGIAMCPSGGTDAETLFRSADTALYKAKESGRGTYAFYTRSMHAAVTSRLSLENDLQQAAARGEFRLKYQPIIAGGRVAGGEALLRWEHPAKGTLYPDLFIPIAEEIGLINELSGWSLKEACGCWAGWRHDGTVGEEYVSVNVSAYQFAQADFVPSVRRTLRETGCPAACLQLEITESFAIRNIEMTVEKLQILRELGVRLAIDDFGTGHSSLNYLKRLPVHALKIDKSFVFGCPTDANDGAIVTAILAMAKGLKLDVTAEGVEREDQLAFLAERGCGSFQGYLFSRAVDAAGFEGLLRHTPEYPLAAAL